MNLKKILGLCEHEWETFATFNVRRKSDNACMGRQYHQRCKKCGKIKIKTVDIL